MSSLNAIADALNKRGIRTARGKELTHVQVGLVLRPPLSGERRGRVDAPDQVWPPTSPAGRRFQHDRKRHLQHQFIRPDQWWPPRRVRAVVIEEVQAGAADSGVDPFSA